MANAAPNASAPRQSRIGRTVPSTRPAMRTPIALGWRMVTVTPKSPTTSDWSTMVSLTADQVRHRLDDSRLSAERCADEPTIERHRVTPSEPDPAIADRDVGGHRAPDAALLDVDRLGRSGRDAALGDADRAGLGVADAALAELDAVGPGDLGRLDLAGRQSVLSSIRAAYALATTLRRWSILPRSDRERRCAPADAGRSRGHVATRPNWSGKIVLVWGAGARCRRGRRAGVIAAAVQRPRADAARRSSRRQHRRRRRRHRPPRRPRADADIAADARRRRPRRARRPSPSRRR